MTAPNISSCTWRLILADHCEDQHAKQLIADEIGASPELWRRVANHAVEIAGTLLISKTNGDFDRATRIAESETSLALEAADRDAKGLPVTPEFVSRCVRTRLEWL
jgi:hypothetical protein